MTQAIVEKPINWKYDDGGRSASGLTYKKKQGDCVCRAIAIATGYSYLTIADIVSQHAAKERITKGRRKQGRSSPFDGVWKQTTRKIMESLGWRWVPTMHVGQGCKVHLRANELPLGRLVVSVSLHLTAVIDRVIYDTFDCSRNGTRCVYGYWHKPTN